MRSCTSTTPGCLRNASLLLFGRITYQLMVPYWPDVAKNQSETEAENEFARVFDSLDKVVFSTTLKHVEGTNTRIVRANVAEEVLALKQQPGKDICVGSLSIASLLSERGLIDEYRFVVHPVVAGKGPRLFETVKPQDRLLLRLYRFGNLSIRRRCPSLQKAYVRRDAMRNVAEIIACCFYAIFCSFREASSLGDPAGRVRAAQEAMGDRARGETVRTGIC